MPIQVWVVLFLLSDYVVNAGYRLWLDNDIIKDV